MCCCQSSQPGLLSLTAAIDSMFPPHSQNDTLLCVVPAPTGQSLFLEVWVSVPQDPLVSFLVVKTPSLPSVPPALSMLALMQVHHHHLRESHWTKLHQFLNQRSSQGNSSAYDNHCRSFLKLPKPRPIESKSLGVEISIIIISNLLFSKLPR